MQAIVGIKACVCDFFLFHQDVLALAQMSMAGVAQCHCCDYWEVVLKY